MTLRHGLLTAAALCVKCGGERGEHVSGHLVKRLSQGAKGHHRVPLIAPYTLPHHILGEKMRVHCGKSDGIGMMAMSEIEPNPGIYCEDMHGLPYASVPNAVLRHKEISLKAKGLWSWMRSHEPGWQFNVQALMRQCADGEKSIRAGLRELQRHGLLRFERVSGEKGHFRGARYVLLRPAEYRNLAPSAQNREMVEHDVPDIPVNIHVATPGTPSNSNRPNLILNSHLPETGVPPIAIHKKPTLKKTNVKEPNPKNNSFGDASAPSPVVNAVPANAAPPETSQAHYAKGEVILDRLTKWQGKEWREWYRECCRSLHQRELLRPILADLVRLEAGEAPMEGGVSVTGHIAEPGTYLVSRFIKACDAAGLAYPPFPKEF